MDEIFIVGINILIIFIIDSLITILCYPDERRRSKSNEILGIPPFHSNNKS